MEAAIIISSNILLQGAAYIILRRPPFLRWVSAAMAIGFAYQIPFLIHDMNW